MYFYLYVFTKAVHIELASHLTSEAFLATLTRFVARCGVPKTILSDNCTDFVGDKNELSEQLSMLQNKKTADSRSYPQFLSLKFY